METKSYTESLPGISDVLVGAEDAVGQEDAELSDSFPSLSDQVDFTTAVIGEEDFDYEKSLPEITETLETDPVSIDPDFSADKTSVAVEEDITFTDLSTGSPETWLWSFGDGEYSSEQNPVHGYDHGGSYTVSLTLSRTDPLSSTTVTETKTGFISVVIGADFEGTPRSGRAPVEVTFTDLSVGNPDSWLWEFGDGQTSTEQNPVHTYAEPGYFDVTLTASRGGVPGIKTKTGYVNTEGSMVDQLIDDISFRIQNPFKERWQFAPHVLRTLNRLYKRLNRDCECLIKTLQIDFSTTENHFWQLPSDFIQLVRLYPQRTFKDPREFVFDGEVEANTGNFVTILGDKLHFNNIGHTETFMVWYISSGLILVDKVDGDLGSGEINEAEWPESALEQILYYGACVELKEKYPNRDHDIAMYQHLLEKIKRSGISRQTMTPEVTGGYGERTGREGNRDDFGYSDARN